jgi:23S rRNA (cytosine1962-C5)-methyltransferase
VKLSQVQEILVSSRAARRLRAGHVWIYQSDIEDLSEASSGEVVKVVARHKSGGSNTLGMAFYSADSQISLRLITRSDRQLDIEFFKSRIQDALQFRSRLNISDSAYRLVYSEADRLPGLIIDRYGDVVVLQTQCAGSERLKSTWVDIVSELLTPRAIIEKNSTPARRLEGLQEQSGVLTGNLDGPFEIIQGGLRIMVDPLEGQKTGAYLDQRENHQAAAGLAHGHCLDAFCYQGGFGLSLARAGAENVTLVDQSEQALEVVNENARLNNLNIETQHANAFDFLKEQQIAGAAYQVVVLDPPAFAKNRKSIQRAARGYKEINLRAMRLLEKGGALVTSSCSYHMSAEHFEAILLEAARDTGRTLQIVQRRGQSRDHPELLGVPESSYLKCYILRVL